LQLTAKKFYQRALTEHWPWYPLGFLSLFITNATEVLTPKFIQWALDAAAGPGEASARIARLDQLALGFALALGVGALGRVGWRQFLARQTHVAGRDLKLRLWDVLRHLPLGVFHRYPLGDLMNRATGDWNASRQIHGFTLVTTFDLVFFTVLSIGSMLIIDVEMTIYCLAVFPLLPRLILRLARREHDQHGWAQEKLGELSQHISQALSAVRLSRATASDELWQRALDREAREYSDRRFEVAKTGWKIFPLGAVPTLIAYAILLVWGVGKIEGGTLTVGEFVALQSYVLMLQSPLFELGEIIAEWQRGFASLGRLVEIFNLQRLSDRQLARRREPSPAAGTEVVRIVDLSFAYPDAAPTLEGVNLVVGAGETVGIAGPIGAGKSTLLRLVAGLIEAPAGHVFVAGDDIGEISRAWLAREVTMVPQRAFLFAGSIRYNLELDSRFDDEALWDVLRLVRLEADVRGFEGGLDTWIGEWGINLSGGQKQRLALARALLRDRRLLLLDDCLSAVDAVTEEAILEAMKARLGGRRAIIWVAHRMSTLRLCDRVHRLEKGVLI
jgi:ATP-binding cassette subfamily B protein